MMHWLQLIPSSDIVPNILLAIRPYTKNVATNLKFKAPISVTWGKTSQLPSKSVVEVLPFLTPDLLRDFLQQGLCILHQLVCRLLLPTLLRHQPTAGRLPQASGGARVPMQPVTFSPSWLPQRFQHSSSIRNHMRRYPHS